MAFTVIYDACVLYPNYLRDILIRIARTHLVRARWSEEILDEVFRSIRTNRPDLDEAKLNRTRELMCHAVDDCLVASYASLVDSIDLPDPGDRHVVAAAIASGAQLIVTNNISDFPAEKLALHNVAAIEPDEFIVNQIDLRAGVIIRVVTEMLQDYRNPPMTLDDLIAVFERAGLHRTASALQDHMGS